jgi:hypothetical protein
MFLSTEIPFTKTISYWYRAGSEGACIAGAVDRNRYGRK